MVTFKILQVYRCVSPSHIVPPKSSTNFSNLLKKRPKTLQSKENTRRSPRRSVLANRYCRSLHDAWAPGKFVLAFNGVLSNTSAWAERVDAPGRGGGGGTRALQSNGGPTGLNGSNGTGRRKRSGAD